MNNLISLDKLKSLIATQSGYDPAFVNIFVEELIALLDELLLQGEEVRLDGWGVFKRIDCKSKNKYKIIFIADPSFRAAINAPFAQFDPVVLAKAAPILLETEHNDELSVNNLIQSETLVSAPVLPDLVVESDENEVEPPLPVEEFTIQSSADTPVADSHKSVVGAEAIRYEDQIVSDTTLPGDDTAKRESEESRPCPDLPMGREEALSSPENFNKVSMKDESLETKGKEDSAEDVLSENELAKEEIDAIEGKPMPDASEVKNQMSASRKIGIWFVLILLATAIIGGFIYFFIRVEYGLRTGDQTSAVSQVVSVPISEEDITANPQENSPEQPSAVPAVSKDSSASSSQSAEALLPAFSYPPLDTVRLTEGDRLTLLAQRFYDNKVFWIYIYEVNKSKYPDPNHVPEGASLIIPDLRSFGIDRIDSGSIKKAAQLGDRILNP